MRIIKGASGVSRLVISQVEWIKTGLENGWFLNATKKLRVPPRDMRDMWAILMDAGWRIKNSKNKLVWQCPCGAHIHSTAKTPSDSHSVANSFRDWINTNPSPCCPERYKRHPSPAPQSPPPPPPPPPDAASPDTFRRNRKNKH